MFLRIQSIPRMIVQIPESIPPRMGILPIVSPAFWRLDCWSPPALPGNLIFGASPKSKPVPACWPAASFLHRADSGGVHGAATTVCCATGGTWPVGVWRPRVDHAPMTTAPTNNPATNPLKMSCFLFIALSFHIYLEMTTFQAKLLRPYYPNYIIYFPFVNGGIEKCTKSAWPEERPSADIARR